MVESTTILNLPFTVLKDKLKRFTFQWSPVDSTTQVYVTEYQKQMKSKLQVKMWNVAVCAFQRMRERQHPSEPVGKAAQQQGIKAKRAERVKKVKGDRASPQHPPSVNHRKLTTKHHWNKNASWGRGDKTGIITSDTSVVGIGASLLLSVY